MEFWEVLYCCATCNLTYFRLSNPYMYKILTREFDLKYMCCKIYPTWRCTQTAITFIQVQSYLPYLVYACFPGPVVHIFRSYFRLINAFVSVETNLTFIVHKGYHVRVKKTYFIKFTLNKIKTRKVLSFYC